MWGLHRPFPPRCRSLVPSTQPRAKRALAFLPRFRLPAMPSTRSNQSQARQRLNVNRKVSKEDLVPNTDVELKKFIETNGHFSLVR